MAEHPIDLPDFTVRRLLAGGMTRLRLPTSDPPTECPFGAPGDVAWVREAWLFPETCAARLRDEPARVKRERDARAAALAAAPRGVVYRVDLTPTEARAVAALVQPSTRMPRSAARILLHVRAVALERVQDAPRHEVEPWGGRETFARAWRELYGPGAWEANPQTWVLDVDTEVLAAPAPPSRMAGAMLRYDRLEARLDALAGL